MMMERPTIATDYSGIREYLNSDVGFPIRTKGLERALGRGFEHWMQWASVDVGHLRQLMRQVASMPLSERQTIGRRARQHIMNKFTRLTIADQIKGRLEHLVDKFNLEGSARKTCLREYKVERARARAMGVLGAAYDEKKAKEKEEAEAEAAKIASETQDTNKQVETAGEVKSESNAEPAIELDAEAAASTAAEAAAAAHRARVEAEHSDRKAMADAAGAIYGADAFLAAVCSTQGPRGFYRDWEGRMLSQYRYWPPHEPVDDENGVDDNVYRTAAAETHSHSREVIRLQSSGDASARQVYLLSLPTSHVATASDADPWEVRRAREFLLEEMRPSAEEERERKKRERIEARRQKERERKRRRLEEAMREMQEAERARAQGG
jgi:hypothetical protein